MTGSPLEPLQHMLISAAIALGAAALVTLSLVMLLRWLGLHWTSTLPRVLLWPLRSSPTLKPTAAVVQRQVTAAVVQRQATTGRRAMPAFGGRLTKPQIDAVARYVASVAGTK